MYVVAHVGVYVVAHIGVCSVAHTELYTVAHIGVNVVARIGVYIGIKPANFAESVHVGKHCTVTVQLSFFNLAFVL